MSPVWGSCAKISAIVANRGDSKGFGAATDLPSALRLPSESVSELVYLLHLLGKKRKDIPWPEGNVPIKKQTMQ